MLNFASVRFIHVLLKSEKSISLDNLLYLITSSSLENNKSVILSKSDILLRFSASQSNPSKERAAVLLEYGPKKNRLDSNHLRQLQKNRHYCHLILVVSEQDT